MIVEHLFILWGAVSFIWGAAILVSNDFFSYWESSFWKEKDGSEKSSSTYFHNRYMMGAGSLVFGAVLMCLALFGL